MDPQHPEHPKEAAPPRTKGPTRTYESDDIRVLWDISRCIHVADCIRKLPEVFDPQARPWVDVNGAPADQIAEAVRACPTGALRYESVGDLDDEIADEPTSVRVRPNGPLYIRGKLEIKDTAGNVIATESRVALCRCGASHNKPFCDNSHRMIGFKD